MTNDDLDMLHNAVARNVGGVLSLPSAGMLRHYKSRLLAEIDDGILVEAPNGENALLNELIASGAPVGVSFRQGPRKVMFAVSVLGLHASWRINADTCVDAVLLQHPDQIKSTQRRANYRVEIRKGSGVLLRVWRIGEQARLQDQPMEAQEVKAEIRDLSAGGVGVKFIGNEDQPPRISVEDRLRIQIIHRNQSLLLEGNMRPPTGSQNGNNIISGIQFKNLESDLEGRRTMTLLMRVVGELQREEARLLSRLARSA
ncbi:MAG: hypothetical protein ABR964_01465 [Tepidisphaeraceae bacterium]